MFLGLCLFVRIVANPFSNVFQKRLTQLSASPSFVVAATLGLLSLGCAPLLWIETWPTAAEFWVNIGIVALLSAAANVLIVEALKRSDQSVLGPINAYKSVVSLAPGIVLLGEIPDAWALTGIVLIVVGSYFLVDRRIDEPRQNVFVSFFRERGVQFRFAALVCSAVEAVYYKRALLAATPRTAFLGWCVLGFLVTIVVAVALNQQSQRAIDRTLFRDRFGVFLLLAMTTGLMQLTTSYVFAKMQVGPALALFQTSALVSVVLGRAVFRERNFWERMIGSLIMVAGAVLVVLNR
jgi:drug/metabolite transporter (DMT)-like permease